MKIKFMRLFVLFFAVTLLGSHVNVGAKPTVAARERNCLYAESKASKPSDTLSSFKDENSNSFFLRGGVYVNVVVWDCTRLGKRILIVVPKSRDTVDYVGRLFSQVVSASPSTFLRALRESFDKSQFEDNFEIVGFETAEFIVSRNSYESIYTITYYTAD